MASENKSRPVLSDLTNRMGKREFPETEESPNLRGTNLPKRVRVNAEALSNKEVSGIKGTELGDGNCNDEYGEDRNLELNQCGWVDCSVLPESQESKNEDECAYNTGDGINSDSIKDCSCSFCTKAGYIWLDLNYQDIKARVSALKNSRKEVSIAAERSIWGRRVSERHCGGVECFSELEYDLMSRWKSLFQHMAEVNERESNQLEARLLQLRGLREKCKTDLESFGDNEKR